VKIIAHTISAIFQPLLMPSLVFFVALFHIDNSTNITVDGQWTILSLVFLTTCLIPVCTILMFRFTKVIKDLQMTNRKDRLLPFAFISIFYLLVTVLFHRQLPLNNLLSATLISMTVVVVLTNLITFFWKISAHSAGIAGLVGFCLVYSMKFAESNNLLFPLLASVLLMGVIMWARLYLNAHKPIEIIAGAILGFVVCFGAIYLFV
jgi:membrane-associated phospholipid phosphatase